MAARQTNLEVFTVCIRITPEFVVALAKGPAHEARRTQRIDARAEIKNLVAIDARALRPALDVAAVSTIDQLRAIDSSAKVASESIAVTRHRARPSFSISISIGCTSSPR